jgi:hypothetical protein
LEEATEYAGYEALMNGHGLSVMIVSDPQWILD